MPDNTSTNTRIKGTVTAYNGIFGMAVDAGGSWYKLHINNIQEKDKGVARRFLRKGSEVEFTPVILGNNRKAVDIKILSMPPVQEPTYLPIGTWERIRGCRCSSCGISSQEETPFCPHCGAAMHDLENYNKILAGTAKTDLREAAAITKEDCSEAGWERVCSAFKIKPEETQGILVGRAIVTAMPYGDDKA